MTDDALPAGSSPEPGPLSGAEQQAADLGAVLLDRLRAASRGTAAAPARRSGRRRITPVTATGSGPDDRDPQPLGEVAARLTSEHGWSTGLTTAGVLGRWEGVVGEDVAAHCPAERFTQGVLTVRADSSAWATQLRMLAPVVLARLAEECGAGTVTELRVLGPGRPSWRSGPLHVSGRGPRDTYG